MNHYPTDIDQHESARRNSQIAPEHADATPTGDRPPISAAVADAKPGLHPTASADSLNKVENPESPITRSDISTIASNTARAEDADRTRPTAGDNLTGTIAGPKSGAGERSSEPTKFTAAYRPTPDLDANQPEVEAADQATDATGNLDDAIDNRDPYAMLDDFGRGGFLGPDAEDPDLQTAAGDQIPRSSGFGLLPPELLQDAPRATPVSIGRTWVEATTATKPPRPSSEQTPARNGESGTGTAVDADASLPEWADLCSVVSVTIAPVEPAPGSWSDKDSET